MKKKTGFTYSYKNIDDTLFARHPQKLSAKFMAYLATAAAGRSPLRSLNAISETANDTRWKASGVRFFQALNKQSSRSLTTRGD